MRWLQFAALLAAMVIFQTGCTIRTGNEVLSSLEGRPLYLSEEMVAELDSHMPRPGREYLLNSRPDATVEWMSTGQESETVAHVYHVEFPAFLMLNDRYLLPLPSIAGPVAETKWSAVWPSATPYRVSSFHRNFFNMFRQRGAYNPYGELESAWDDRVWLSPILLQFRTVNHLPRDVHTKEFQVLLGALFQFSKRNFGLSNGVDREARMLYGWLWNFYSSHNNDQLERYEVSLLAGIGWASTRGSDGESVHGPLWSFIGWSSRPGVVFAPRVFWRNLW